MTDSESKLTKVSHCCGKARFGYGFTGNMLIGFAVTELICVLTFAYFLDSLRINILPVILIGLGCSVRRGSRSAAYWSLTIMGIYLAGLIPMIIVGIVRPELYRIGHRPISPAAFPYVFGFANAALCWVIINMTLLLRLLIISRPKPD
jgi:hypothetical protein